MKTGNLSLATDKAVGTVKGAVSFDFEGNDTFKLPPLKLLKTPPKTKGGAAQEVLEQNAEQLKKVLSDFRIGRNRRCP